MNLYYLYNGEDQLFKINQFILTIIILNIDYVF
jgi:hypothetical protein